MAAYEIKLGSNTGFWWNESHQIRQADLERIMVWQLQNTRQSNENHKGQVKGCRVIMPSGYRTFAQSQFIGPGWERGSLISIDRSIQWYILGYFSAVSWLYSLQGAYRVRSRPGLLPFGRCMHCSESWRECIQLVWPHRVTGLLTGNLPAHALASCALPCHGQWPIVLVRRTYTLIHEPSEVTSRQPPPWHRGSNIYIYIQTVARWLLKLLRCNKSATSSHTSTAVQ